jgi:hypothetical protein
MWRSSSSLRAPGAALFPQDGGERLDAVKDLGDPRLVMRQNQALGEDVGDHLQSLGRLLAQHDVAGKVDRLLRLRPDQQPCIVPFRGGKRRGDQGHQRSDEIVHRSGRCAEQDDRAIAEQHGNPAVGEVDGQGSHTERRVALQRARIQALAQQERGHGQDFYRIGRKHQLGRALGSDTCRVLDRVFRHPLG